MEDAIDDTEKGKIYQQIRNVLTNEEKKEIEAIEAEAKKRGRLTEEYSIASLFTPEQLIHLLDTKDFIQENKLIFITSHKHATALFKTGGVYFFLRFALLVLNSHICSNHQRMSLEV